MKMTVILFEIKGLWIVLKILENRLVEIKTRRRIETIQTRYNTKNSPGDLRYSSKPSSDELQFNVHFWKFIVKFQFIKSGKYRHLHQNQKKENEGYRFLLQIGIKQYKWVKKLNTVALDLTLSDFGYSL